MRFTVGMFQNEVPHFLVFELSPDGITIFRKGTNTCLYINFTSFVPWTYCTSWIRSLVSRASRPSLTDKLSFEINIIKRFASWNDFPKSVVNSISIEVSIHHLLLRTLTTQTKQTMELLSIFVSFTMAMKVVC